MEEEDDGLWREQLLPPTLGQDLARNKRWQEAFRQAHPKKVCSKCGETFHRDPRFFRRNCASVDGLRSQCWACESKRVVREQRPGMKQCSRCQHWYLADTAHFPYRLAARDRLDSWCWECRREVDRKRKARSQQSPHARLIGERAARRCA